MAFMDEDAVVEAEATGTTEEEDDADSVLVAADETGTDNDSVCDAVGKEEDVVIGTDAVDTAAEEGELDIADAMIELLNVVPLDIGIILLSVGVVPLNVTAATADVA